MGQLPAERITSSRPFTHIRVDYAGPNHQNMKGKKCQDLSYKVYIALFVCYAISAIHLELVIAYTAKGFIAFKRFTARRGICSTLFSDCGTNFKDADAELQRLFILSTQTNSSLC